ncbi:hypothetical protein ACIBAC_14395 [Streptomyces sp. NPDC051362]|uniref:hypothetical protein n=1 Tax=Streptomyces sp. NPDC051362 TaxID=3365651 RepID=UPI0037A19B67
MRPVKRALVGWPRALRELKELLYEVYLAAGAPSLDAITEDIAADKNDGLLGAPSRDTVHRVITDGERPGQQADVIAVATVLARRAAWDAPDLTGRVRELWIQALMAQGAGRPIGDLRGDVRLILDGGLGVHRALDTGGACDRFGTLPTYVPREHDACLKTVIDAAKEDGRSGIAVLVGGSSTGKTRALWEAVGELPDGWRLLHPLSPTAPEAALAALQDIAPKTVVWLNEAQFYLEPDPLGEQVAAGLRELLHDSSRAPVLVLGTLWPGHWDTLTARTTDDRHAGARELLGGHKIDVPDSFTTAELAALDTTANADPRLTQAGQHAKGAQVTQYLAGVPYLMARYDAARGATLALIHAAMDARRLGAGLHIPLDWLADAAPGYLDDDYHTLDGDWLSKALAYVTTPCNGVPGILTPVTTSGPRNQRTRRRPAVSGTPADQPAPSPQGPRYLLADYLDQHGRHHRASRIPPIDFWTAAAHHAHPTDLTTLGNAAWDRGLYRDAAQLHKLSIRLETRLPVARVTVLGRGPALDGTWLLLPRPAPEQRTAQRQGLAEIGAAGRAVPPVLRRGEQGVVLPHRVSDRLPAPLTRCSLGRRVRPGWRLRGPAFPLLGPRAFALRQLFVVAGAAHLLPGGTCPAIGRVIESVGEGFPLPGAAAPPPRAGRPACRRSRVVKWAGMTSVKLQWPSHSSGEL